MKIVKTAPRIKLIIHNEDYKERLKWLDEVSWDIQKCRNSAVRYCVEYMNRGGIFGDFSNEIYSDYIKPKEVIDKKTKEIKINYNFNIIKYIVDNRPKEYLKHNIRGVWSLYWASEREVIQDFKNYYVEILSGQRKIPYYKDQSIYFKGLPTENKNKEGEFNSGSKMWKETDENNRDIYFFQPVAYGFNGKPTIFKGINIHKSKNMMSILRKIEQGVYKFCDSKIIKDGKFWYLHLSYSFEQNKVQELDYNTIVGVDVGWIVPAYCGVNNSLERKSVGDSHIIKKFRTQIKNRRKNLQANLNLLNGTGHGYNRKAKVLESLKEKESNFVKTYNHTLSKSIIDFALKNKAGIIHLEKLDKEVKSNAFLTAYWSYYQLQQMIEYKAKDYGIEVKYIYPDYTSQMCSKCGYVHSDNRKKQSDFLCVNCGYKSNADYNASVNISRSTQLVEDKKENIYVTGNGFLSKLNKEKNKIFFELINKSIDKEIVLTDKRFNELKEEYKEEIEKRKENNRKNKKFFSEEKIILTIFFENETNSLVDLWIKK